MDEYKSKSWKVMADYGCGLWDDRGWGTAPDDDEINASDDYVNRFDAWVYKYDDAMEGKLDLDSFNKEGHALAAELKQIVGPGIKVTYVYEKPTGSEYAGPGEEEMP